MSSVHETLMRDFARPVLREFHQRTVQLLQDGGAAAAVNAIVGTFRAATVSDENGVRMVEQGGVEVVETDGLTIGLQDVIEIDGLQYNVIASGKPQNGFIAVGLERQLVHEMSRSARGDR